MNLTNYEHTSMFEVFQAVKREAARHGVSVLESEIIGLVPAAALAQPGTWTCSSPGSVPHQILENRLRDVRRLSLEPH